MPQLDFIIAFPQIFWLIVIFFSVYIILIHFFMPQFIKILKARKYIIIENSKTLNFLQDNFKDKQQKLNKVILRNVLKIKLMLEKEVSLIFNGSAFMDLSSVDKKIASALYHNMLYYDISVLKIIPLKPIF